MTMLGLIGGPLIVASATAIVFGAYKNGSAPSSLAALPEIAWEASLAIHLIVKGFKPSPMLAQATRQVEGRRLTASSPGGPACPWGR